MSEFSQMLESYVNEKKVNKFQMAKYLSIDRSSLHKIIQGQRNAPSKNLVIRIGQYLELSPYELNELLELYSISLISPQRYYRRKNVQLFLESFDPNPSLVEMPSFQASNLPGMNRSVMPLKTNAINLEHLLYQINEKEKESGKGVIRFLGTPELPGFENLFAQLRSGTQVKHILPFVRYENAADYKSDQNFLYLSKVVSMYAQFADRLIDYQTSYYYSGESIRSHFPPFPYWVVTTEYALQISEDYKEGIIYQDPDMIAYMAEIFDRLWMRTNVLLIPVQDGLSQLHLNQELLKAKTDSEIHFSLLPCLMPFLTRREIEKYLAPELPEREGFIDLLDQYITAIRQRHALVHPKMIFSLDGIKRFLEEGVFDEFPQDLYSPLEMDDRKRIYSRFLQKANQYEYKLLKENMGTIVNGIRVNLSDSMGFIQFMTHSGKVILLSLEHPGFLASFKDYFETMDPDRFFTPEETMEKLNKLQYSI